LPLPDALPIWTIRYDHDESDRLAGIAWEDGIRWRFRRDAAGRPVEIVRTRGRERIVSRIRWQGEHAIAIEHPAQTSRAEYDAAGDRKSTRLNSSHVKISYAVFCLKKKSFRRMVR